MGPRHASTPSIPFPPAPAPTRPVYQASSLSSSSAASNHVTTTAILSHALDNHVPSHGFSRAALSASLSDLSLSPSLLGAFPRTNYASRQGSPELVEHFWTRAREGLRGAVDEEKAIHAGGGVETIEWKQGAPMRSWHVRPWTGEWEAMPLAERVRVVTVVRVAMTARYAEWWADALATMSQPQNLASSLHHLAGTADEIWYLAGCRSTDISWYTRRATLSAVLSATELHLTRDPDLSLLPPTSPPPPSSPTRIPFSSTYAFLSARFDELEQAEARLKGVGQNLEFGARAAVGLVEAKTGWGRWI